MNYSLTVANGQLQRADKPHRLFSGALHYFRVLPEYWEDRLRKYRACGLNTVETYVAWNLHEPTPGEFCFEGLLNIRRFIELAGSLGLDVIVRPGPYICAEFDFGGLPAWLLGEAGLRVRTLDSRFTTAVERYMQRFLQELDGLYSHQGGPIIAMQVENEYGSYGCNRPYMEWNEQLLLRLGVEVLLFTSDGPTDSMLQGGTLPHLLKTVNFGSQARDAFKKLEEYQPNAPAMCMEFWNGWFDHWGESHHGRSASDAATALDEILAAGGSVNVYMMHGGTNFGFWNGANHDGTYRPTVTSYDYDAPLDEQGRPTDKYHAFREVFAKHGASIEEVPATVAPVAYGEVPLEGSKSLFELLPSRFCLESLETLTMEEAGQNFGYILYRTTISGPRPEGKLYLQEVRDRAWVYLDGVFLGVVGRNEVQAGLPITLTKQHSQLDIFVENLGRVNYGPELHDRKGITHGVRLNNQYLAGWQIYPLDFTRPPHLPVGDVTIARAQSGKGNDSVDQSGPRFYKGGFTVSEPSDTFLKIDGRHGAAWINGFCLGRFWDIGPQQTLYVPAPLLRAGENEVLVFEIEPDDAPPKARFVAEALLDGPARLV